MKTTCRGIDAVAPPDPLPDHHVMHRLDGLLQPDELAWGAGADCGAESFVAVLQRHHGDLARVAEVLGVSLRTVQRRIKERGLRRQDFRH